MNERFRFRDDRGLRLSITRRSRAAACAEVGAQALAEAAVPGNDREGLLLTAAEHFRAALDLTAAELRAQRRAARRRPK